MLNLEAMLFNNNEAFKKLSKRELYMSKRVLVEMRELVMKPVPGIEIGSMDGDF